jgi:uncharacterized protein YbjT (DUF2867 family)
MTSGCLVLVTGAAGGVGRTVVELLREGDMSVRAMVHRQDERADALRSRGAEVVVGELTRPADVARALDGAGRILFSMSVSPVYLEAAATVATVARTLGGVEVLVNISQMTVSQMSVVSTEESRQQRLHWLSENVLEWSGLPVVRVRPTVFLDNPLFTALAARSVAADGILALPFGAGRTSPVAATDVARVIAAILKHPSEHIGQVHELTGPRCQDMTGVAAEYSRALGRPVSYADVPLDAWVEQVLDPAGFPPHLRQHLFTMARLHHQNRYDRLTRTVEQITGTPAQTIEDFVAQRSGLFTR